MLVADLMNLPFIYSDQTLKSMVEKSNRRKLEKGQNVVVIEDLISTGNSSLVAVDALREAELKVKGMISIFTYGFPISYEIFKKECRITYFKAPTTSYLNKHYPQIT